MDRDELRAAVRSVVDDPSLTYPQRRHRLASLAEDVLEYPPLGEAARLALEKGLVCDLYEGHAPYRPRYVLPDYERAVRQGSAFLELDPPQDLDEAVTFLLILYSQVPSITGYPVYVGDLDKVLAPFVDDVDDRELHRKLRLLWLALDRMFPDAFLHTDLGPGDSRVARTVLALERELRQVVPNLTLKVDPERTPDSLLLDAVQTVFECGQPHFVNHPMMVGDHGEGYAAVSCYNSLKIGGGAHTLVRLNLREAVLHHTGGVESFLSAALPVAVELTAEVIEARVRHLVEQARFYDHSFLVDEGLIDLRRFSAMFGIFGLAEAVDLLMEREGLEGTYGHSPAAAELSYRITEAVSRLVAGRPMPYCDGGGGRCYLHSQSGIDSDVGVTAGTRIPVGTEPDLYQHLRTVAPHHRLFAAGVSDVLSLDDTALANPQAVVDMIRGGFRQGMRDVTFNLDSNDFVRVTGYLVRKSDLARAATAGTRHGSDTLAAGSEANTHPTARVPKRVVSHERDPRPAG